MSESDETRGREKAKLLGRAGLTTRSVAARLRRKPALRSPLPPVHPWTAAMSVLAVAAFLASLAAALLVDPFAVGFVRAHHSDPLMRLLASITDLGASQWYLVPAGLAVVTLALADWSARGPRSLARLTYVFGMSAYLFASVALSGLAVNLVKILIGRARPVMFDVLGPLAFRPFRFDYAFLSYPSGHSTTVGAVVMALVLLVPCLRWPALLAGAAVAFSRVAALAHYPADVIAGFAFGLLFALWLARWLALRGLVFRVAPGRLLPVARHRLAWRTMLRKQ